MKRRSCRARWTEAGSHHSAGRVLTNIVVQCQTLKYTVLTEFCSTLAASGAASRRDGACVPAEAPQRSLAAARPYIAPFPNPRYSLRRVQRRVQFGYHSCVLPPSVGFSWDDLRKILLDGQWTPRLQNGIETLHERCRLTDDRRITDLR